MRKFLPLILVGVISSLIVEVILTKLREREIENAIEQALKNAESGLTL